MSGDHAAEDREAWERLGDELRQRVGEDFRAEAEEGERLAGQARRRRRALADVVREAMARGDTVLLVVGERHVTGTVRYAASDLATLDTPGGRVDVHLPTVSALRVVERAPLGGREPQSGPGSFKARLYELELEGRIVDVGSRSLGSELRARVAAVAVDHVTLVDSEGGEWFVPLASLVWLAER